MREGHTQQLGQTRERGQKEDGKLASLRRHVLSVHQDIAASHQECQADGDTDGHVTPRCWVKHIKLIYPYEAVCSQVSLISLALPPAVAVDLCSRKAHARLHTI